MNRTPKVCEEKPYPHTFGVPLCIYAIKTGRQRRNGCNVMNSEEIHAIYRDEFGVEAISLRWDGCLVFRTVIRECVCEIDSDFDGIWILEGTLSGDTFPFHFNEGCIWEFSLTMTFPFRLGPETDRMGQLVIQSRKFGDSQKQP